MVTIKNLRFFQLFVLCNIHREKVFGDVLVGKKAFLENRNMALRKPIKIGIFPKGLFHDFGQKVYVFFSFVFIKNKSRKSVC